MTSLPIHEKMAIRYGRLLFNISFQHLGSRYFHVASESPTFIETLGVKDYVFFVSQIPEIFVGAEGNVIATVDQLALLDTISSAITKHLGYTI